MLPAALLRLATIIQPIEQPDYNGRLNIPRTRHRIILTTISRMQRMLDQDSAINLTDLSSHDHRWVNRNYENSDHSPVSTNGAVEDIEQGVNILEDGTAIEV